MRQAGILAAAGLVALDTMRARLSEDHARARRLAEGLVGIPGLRVDLAGVQSNIVHVGTAAGRALDWVRAVAARGVQIIDMGPAVIRFVTHCDVGDADVAAALEAMRAVAPVLAGR
jgi:threonine aldolase